MQVLNVEKQEFTLKKNKNKSTKGNDQKLYNFKLGFALEKTNVLHWKRKSREDSARLVN